MTTRLHRITRGLGLLTAQERRATGRLLVLMLVSGLLELAVITAVAPFVLVLTNPEIIEQNVHVQDALRYLSVTSIDSVLPWSALALALSIAAQSAMTMLNVWVVEKQSAASRTRLSHDLLEDIVKAPMTWLGTQNSAVLARQIYSDTRTWRFDFIQPMLIMIQSGILIIFPVIALIAMAPAVGLLSLCVIGLLCFGLLTLIRKPLSNNAHKVKRLNDLTMKNLLQLLTGVREIKASTREQAFIEDFDRAHHRVNMVTAFIKLLVQMNSSTVIALGQIGFVFIAISLWLSGLSSAQIIAQLAIIGVITSRVLPHVNRVMGLINTLQTSLPIVDALIETRHVIHNAHQKFPDPTGNLALPADWKTLSFHHAGYVFPDATDYSLKDVNITLERGKSYGVVGPSGAGKSTFVNLILGLLPATSGDILIDDISLQDLDISRWRKQCGYVAQNVFILDESLRHNITFHDSLQNPEKLQRVIDTARLGAFVDKLPAGLDSSIGEAGKLVSGGQAQRISIARALYREPDILILDEATSALDSITEQELQHRLEQSASQRLTLAIAHRLSTLRNCDCIFVLDKGQVVASGDWVTLMQESPLFRQLAANPAHEGDAS